MDLVSGTAMTVIIIFVVALLAAAGYVLWFAITNGIWNALLSNISALERDILNMVSQAEKNAKLLGGLITRDFKQVETELAGAYTTVATTLINTGIKVKEGGDNAINTIRSVGQNTIRTIETTFKDVASKVSGETKNAVTRVESTALDTIGQIRDTATLSIRQIETAYNTIKSSITDTSKKISKESKAIIDKIKADLTSGYQSISTSTTNAYTTVNSASTAVANQIRSETADIIARIRNGGDTAINTITRTTNSVVNLINTGTLQLINQIASETTGAANRVVTGATSTYQTVTSAVVAAAAKVKTAGDTAVSSITSTYDTTAGAITNAFNTAKTEVTGAVQTSIITVETASTSAISKIKTESNTAISDIKSAFTELQTSFTNTTSTVTAQSQATIKLIQDAVTSSYATISQGAIDASAAAKDAALAGISQVKNAGNQAATTATTVTADIERKTASALAQITSQSTITLNQITAGSTTLTQQITAAAVAVGALNARIPQGFQNPSIEAFQSSDPDVPVSEPALPISESLFFNVQYLSIRDTGFLGPYPSGSYKEDIATANVIKAGCRFLTLQIDYTDTKMDLSVFEAPGVPTLLIRGPTGRLLSKNSGSIEDVAKTIATMAFNEVVPNNTMPLILYLHVVRAPSAVSSPEDNMNFLSQIAAALNPLAPFHLGLHPQGNFTRQKMAEQLLTMPISSLSGNIIIMSNADTSLFRGSSVSKRTYPPAKDLDFWVNVRVYLDDPADANGITELADPSVNSAAVLVNMKRVLALSGLKKDSFAARGKRRFVIAMSERLVNPTPTELNTALNALGVNTVPIDIFTEDSSNVVLLSNEYENKSYRAKPVALQYTS